MSLNTNSAISYNKERGYSQQATAIIQNFANAKTSGVFDAATVQAVYKMQQSPLYPFKFAADGKVGANTLGVIIMELENVGRKQEASVLRSYPYTMQGVADESNPVASFTHATTEPLLLRTDKFSWYSMQGVFIVRLKLNPNLPNPSRYEYRQKIKGGAWSKLGDWTGSTWTAKPDAEWIPESDGFQVPSEGILGKGLYMNNWKEDGQLVNGNAERFGYRAKEKTVKPGLLDMYVPDQSGPQYELKDTFGISRKSPYVKGARLWITLSYLGCVIDTTRPVGDQVIFSKQWNYQCEDTLP